MQDGRRFSYITVNFHPEVRMYLKPLPDAGRQLLFLYCSKQVPLSENLFKKTLSDAGQQALFLHCSRLPS